MATSKIYQNLVGSSRKAKYPAVMGSEWSCNMYPGKNGDQVYMESLPGLRMVSNIGGRCRGCYVSTIGLKETASTEDMFAVMGNVLYRFDAQGNRTKIGRVANNGRRVSFAEAGGPRALLLIADGANLFYYDLVEGGELRQIQLPERITAEGGTITPTHVAVVAGSIIVNDAGSGYAYFSEPYPLNNDIREMYDIVDGQVQYEDDGVHIRKVEVQADQHVFEDDFGVVKYLNGESSSDNLVALYAVGPTLYLFGAKSVDVYQRGSGEYEEWIRVSYTSTNSFGLEAPDSVSSVGGTVYFVASGAQYGKCVMKVEGTQFSRISEEFLEEKLLRESTESSYSFCYSVGEHQFLCLQLNGIGQTWVYDALDGGWHQRTSRSKTSGDEVQWRPGGIAYFREKFWAFTNDGCLCRFQDDYWMEDYPGNVSIPVIRHRQTPVMIDGLKPFVLEEIAVEANCGTWQDYEQKPMLLLEISKDGGNTFGNVKSASLGRTGDYSHRVRYLNLGLNRLCVMRFTYSHSTDLVLTSCAVRAEATGAMI